MKYAKTTQPTNSNPIVQTLADIKDHYGFIKFLENGIRYQSTYHAISSKVTETERAGEPPLSFMLLATMEIVGNMQFSRAFAYTFAGNIHLPEDVSSLSLAFTGQGLGKSEPVYYRDACFATIYSANGVGLGGRLWIKAEATASSIPQKLNVIIR